MTNKLEPGDWCVDYPTPLANLCYEVRQVTARGYVLLRSLHVQSRLRFNCSSDIQALVLFRKKDGRRVTPAVRCG